MSPYCAMDRKQSRNKLNRGWVILTFHLHTYSIHTHYYKYVCFCKLAFKHYCAKSNNIYTCSTLIINPAQCHRDEKHFIYMCVFVYLILVLYFAFILLLHANAVISAFRSPSDSAHVLFYLCSVNVQRNINKNTWQGKVIKSIKMLLNTIQRYMELPMCN